MATHACWVGGALESLTVNCRPRKSPAVNDTAPVAVHDCELPATTHESDVELSDGLVPQRKVKFSLAAPGAESTVTIRESTVHATGISTFEFAVSVLVLPPVITLKN